jgi:hypothetical protein
MVQNNQKTGFYSVFGRLWVIWALPDGAKNVDNGRQVGKMVGTMLNLENKPQPNH